MVAAYSWCGRTTFRYWTAALALACGIGLAATGAPAHAHGYQVLYAFAGSLQGRSDGASPRADLITVGGLLYGTTSGGGDGCTRGGCGTVFSLDLATGIETVLHAFDGHDGGDPVGRLVEDGGLLYGTAEDGGGPGRYGTLFSLNPATDEFKVLYAFPADTRGYQPSAGLVDVDGTLYGSTFSGGDYGAGTVFSFDPTTGRHRVLHSFGSGGDGQHPEGELLELHGQLYGTTIGGGAFCNCGTVWSVDRRTGAEQVLHLFQPGGADGAQPYAGLVEADGTLFGTTQNGGAGACACGTVFSINLQTGVEQLAHSFQGGAHDGSTPNANLVKVGNTLKGTTIGGGPDNDGTAFSLNLLTGNYRVWHSFVAGQDGAVPLAGLLSLSGVLYGTTFAGGSDECGDGCGTLFAITP